MNSSSSSNPNSNTISKTTESKLWSLPPARHVELPVDEIVIVADRNPRQHFAHDRLLQLGESLVGLGQLQEICVNSTEEVYELVTGERRLRAAKEYGRKLIECRVYQDLTDEQMALMVHAENTDREELNVIERAMSLENLAGAGLVDAELARREHCSVETVRRLLSLLKLPDDIQQMMVRAKSPLPTHQAQLLLKLPTDQRLAMAKRIAPPDGPVAGEGQVRKWIKAEIGTPLIPEPAEPAESDEAAEHDASKKSTKSTKTSADSLGDASHFTPPNPDGETSPSASGKSGKLKPVSVTIGVIGLLHKSKADDGRFLVQNATITVKAGEHVEILYSPWLELPGETEDNLRLEKMLTAAQPAKKPSKKAAKKAAKKAVKKTVKKKTKKTGKGVS